VDTFGLREEETEEERDRTLRHFLHDVVGNSSTSVSDDADPKPESDVQQRKDTFIMTRNMSVVDGGSEFPEQAPEPEFHLKEGASGVVYMPGPVAPHAWSSTWAQARAEAARLQAEEERFSRMKEADRYLLNMGLEPIPCEQFADEISQTGETQFQAIEQRTCEEQVSESGEQPGPGSLVGATLVVRSVTTITALRMISHGWNSPGATVKIFSMMAETLPNGAQLDLIVSTPVVLRALGCCADIISHDGDIDMYCQDPEWKEVMVQWKGRQIQASVREVDENGADSENSPFLKLSTLEAIQAVKDGLEGQPLPVEVDRSEDDQ
jgi:hypothetical protein